MKTKTILISACAVITVISIAVIAVNALSSATGADAQKEDVVTPLYLIKDYNGQIAVFKYNSDIPQEVLSARTAGLPEFDKIALKTGIPVYSESELARILEDFDS